jgi:protein-S-isoprenylcysteine O-methyltransferase Ste14
MVYWAGVIAEVAIRAPLRKSWKTAAKTDQRVSRTEKVILGLLGIPMIVLPMIFSVTNCLNSANYRLPAWMGWLGVCLLGCAVLIFSRAHVDLKSNWSPTLEIFEGHTLVTYGIYGHIRHPMYASQWLWVIAQILLLQNWVAGPTDLIVFIPFYLLRVKAEEKMMLDTFGDRYRDYMKKTGRVVPGFSWRGRKYDQHSNSPPEVDDP